jgi:predicted AAA+ superfamily ATPase
MQTLLERSDFTILSTQYPYQRDALGAINWEWRMNGIMGARGVGKTTLLLQRLKQYKSLGHEVLYARLDDLYFTENKVYELAETYRRNGGEYLYLDEVHKYPDWARELKNIYDNMPGLKIVFSGSSIVELRKQDIDLSRRALLYEMPGLSFREYLVMAGISNPQAYKLEEILENHQEIAAATVVKIPALKHFKNYLKTGYFPYFLETHRDYMITLEQVIRTVIEVDLQVMENFDVAKSRQVLTLLRIIAASAPFKPNIAKISEKTGLHRQTILQYLTYLEKAKIIRLLNRPDKYISRLQKPDKVFLDNPNLFHALNPGQVNVGSLRETFTLNQLTVRHQVFLHEWADFLVDGRYILEIGGKNKDTSQNRDLRDVYFFVDDIEIGNRNVIPLWLLGFLY